MSDPTGGNSRLRHEQRRSRLRAAQQGVNEANAALETAHEVFGPKHPTVKKLTADSVDAVANRSEAVKKYQRGE